MKNYREILEKSSQDKEAEEAAQKVFDKYTNEYINRIKKQMLNGDVLGFGMGACYFKDKKKRSIYANMENKLVKYLDSQETDCNIIAYFKHGYIVK